MKVRTFAGVLVGATSLVAAMALPSHAASSGIVTFAGTIRLSSTLPGAGQTAFCFLDLGAQCANGLQPTGNAAGAASSLRAIDGLQGSAAYTETCVQGIPVTGNATILAKVHEALPTEVWSGDIRTQWTRAGLVAVMQGDATGVAIFAPRTPAACGTAADAAVLGIAEVTY
ncbi:MAG TPA: hypothetical protein VFQ85_15840 [Mycobacteriales bacterium]|jgi:hypothetical protein|nr:hypothetical protein [Mycobacteriales bacterium]